MLKKPYIIFIIFFLSSCAQLKEAVFTPTEIERYCRQVFGNSGYDDQSFNTCVSQESDAKARINKMTVPAEVEKYCSRLSGRTGGSYQVMLTCIEQRIRSNK